MGDPVLGCTGIWGTLSGEGDQKLGGTKMMGMRLGGRHIYGLHHERWGPRIEGGDQKLGGTKMMGVQLDGGRNYGLHHGRWGPRIGEEQGETKNWGYQNDGGAVE